MKKIWIGVLAALLLLTACGRAEKPAAVPTAVPADEVALRLAEKAETEKDGVLLKIESFDDGMLHIRLINHSGKTWYYGESYSLFKRNAEDGWTSVPDERSWIMIAYELEDGDEVVFLETSVDRGNEREITVKLENMPKRPRATTRLSCSGG